MKIDSEYTQDEAFRPYKIVIQVESNADQEALRNLPNERSANETCPNR